MDAATQLFFELLDACQGDFELLFAYLTELLGSVEAAEQAIITEDVVL